MNYELLNKIIAELEVVSPFKAKKIERLIDEYDAQPGNAPFRKDIEKKIFNTIYATFCSLLSRKSRDELYYVATSISEECYSVERSADNGWYINNGGAGRYVIENGETITKCYIPRKYKKGFIVSDKPAESVEERKEQLTAMDFYNTYASRLENIASLMDRKQEIISFDYQTKNEKVSRDLMDIMIEYLHFMKLTPEEMETVFQRPQEQK